MLRQGGIKQSISLPIYLQGSTGASVARLMALSSMACNGREAEALDHAKKAEELQPGDVSGAWLPQL